MEQQNRTDDGRIMGSPSPAHVKNTEEREKSPRRSLIQFHVLGQAFPQHLRAFVVQPAATHINSLDLRGRGGFDGVCRDLQIARCATL